MEDVGALHLTKDIGALHLMKDIGALYLMKDIGALYLMKDIGALHFPRQLVYGTTRGAEIACSLYKYSSRLYLTNSRQIMLF